MIDIRPTTAVAQGPLLRPSGGPLVVLAVAVLIIFVLHTGREIFVPIALAILLSFVLAPLVRFLRRIRIQRTLAVIVAVVFAFSLITGLAYVMASEITRLAADLPRYQETMRAKIVSLKGAAAASDAMEQAADVLARLATELERPEPEDAPAVTPGTVDPMPVIIQEPARGSLQTLAALIAPLIHPFATTGIVIIFVIFILLQREDLRNRFIKLVGAHDLQKTTEVLDDAAYRLSRLLLTQVALNALFGLVIGVGLYAIGVPIAALWGILAGVLRFVPYIGAIIGAALPLILSAAVDPGWTMLWQTALLFAIVEPIVGHFIEPMVYGHSTGLSPVAIVVAATFWTWLWGPIGLVLATPVTVCLVVLGRHIKGLAFIELLLGNQPALSPPELFYQRMLAGDASEITAVAEEVLKERSLSEYFDQIALPGLRLAQADAVRGVLDDGRQSRIRDTAEEVVDDLDSYGDISPVAGQTDDAEAAAAVDAVVDESDLPILRPADLDPAWSGDTAVLVLAGESPLDEAGAAMLARLLAKHGVGARHDGPETLSAKRLASLDLSGTMAVAICFFGGHAAQKRHAIRRIRRRLGNGMVVLCDFGSTTDPVAPDLAVRTEADHAVATLRGSLSVILDAARTAGATRAVTPAASPTLSPATIDPSVGPVAPLPA